MTAQDDVDAIKLDVNAIDVQISIRCANCSHDPAPVGILTKQGSLDQVGAYDCLSDVLSIQIISRALDVGFNQLSCPLAITGNLFGQRAQHLMVGLGKDWIIRVVRRQ